MQDRKLPETLQQRSARGGTHYIFRSPLDAQYPGTLGKGIDLKYRGYILLDPSSFIDPSTHEKGIYSWINDVEPADAPDWLLSAKLDRSRVALPKPVLEPSITSPRSSLNSNHLKNEASQGINWHSNVLRLAGQMVAFGTTDAEIYLETDALTLDGYTIEQTRTEIQAMAESARAKGFGNRVYAHRGISVGSIEDLQKTIMVNQYATTQTL